MGHPIYEDKPVGQKCEPRRGWYKVYPQKFSLFIVRNSRMQKWGKIGKRKEKYVEVKEEKGYKDAPLHLKLKY